MIIDSLIRTLMLLGIEEEYDQWHSYNDYIWKKHKLILDEYWKMMYGDNRN